MKKTLVGVILAGLMSMSLVACGEPESEQDEYAAVCVDPNTELRLEDDACDTSDDDFLAYAVIWYMLASHNSHIPGVGHKVSKSKVKTTKPKGAIIKKVSEKGYTYKAPAKKKSSNNGSSNKKKSGGGFGGSKSGGSKSGRR